MQVLHTRAKMFNDRLQNVEKLLRTLDQMPVLEPSPNLVARTLDRIEQTERHIQPTPGKRGRNSANRPTA